MCHIPLRAFWEVTDQADAATEIGIHKREQLPRKFFGIVCRFGIELKIFGGSRVVSAMSIFEEIQNRSARCLAMQRISGDCGLSWRLSARRMYGRGNLRKALQADE